MAKARDMADSRSFARSIDSLAEIFDFIEGFFSAASIPQDHLFPVQLVVEELFTNQVKYQPNGATILLEMQREGDDLRVRLTDFGVEPFDIRTAREPRVDVPLEGRRPGGLGIHILKKMVDTIDYEYLDGRSTTTLTKSLR